MSEFRLSLFDFWHIYGMILDFGMVNYLGMHLDLDLDC